MAWLPAHVLLWHKWAFHKISDLMILLSQRTQHSSVWSKKSCTMYSVYIYIWTYFLSRTTQSQQWRKLPAVVHPGRICRTRHPKVLVDGGGGYDAAVHRGDPPVAVWYANPDHHPADETQHHSHHFHDWIHDDPSSAKASTKNFIQSFKNEFSQSCRENPSAWFRVSSWSVQVCEMRYVWLSRHA